MSSFYARLKLNSILLPILVAIGMLAYFVVLNLVLTLVSIPLPQSSAVRYFLIPVIFAFPWILFVFIFRERTINASEIMNAKGNLIPLRWRMLYGFNTFIILSFLGILPVFAKFWRHVFHPLLFKNKLWLNTTADLSFYIMPRQFFKYTMAMMIVCSCLLNLLLWMCFKRVKKTQIADFRSLSTESNEQE